MHRLALNLARCGPRTTSLAARLCQRPASVAVPLQPALINRTYATSSPKEAEAASAQSGGSRSKDAVEAAADGDVDAKGRTGGGEPLESSVNPPAQPKVRNASVPLGKGKDALSPEQQEEVDRHNADFDKKHDRAASAAEDKVNKDFWRGTGGRDGQ